MIHDDVSCQSLKVSFETSQGYNIFQIQALKRGEHLIIIHSSSSSLPPFNYQEMRVLGSLPKRSIIPPSTSSSLYVRAFSLLTKPSSRLYHPATDLLSSHQVRQLSSTTYYKMSFSNTTVPGDKPADPYKATNLTDPDLKEKIEDLVSFMESCKFGMMTTRIESSGLLTSRCMALAAKVGPSCPGSSQCLSSTVIQS